MALGNPTVDDLLRYATRGEVRAAVAELARPLTLPDANRLAVHLRTLAEPMLPLRLGVVHTYTSDLLDPWLDLGAALQGFEVTTYHAPLGWAIEEGEPHSGLVRHQPDITLLLLQQDDLHPALARPIATLEQPALNRIRREALDRLRHLVARLRSQPVGFIVVTLLPGLEPPTLGMYDMQCAGSERQWWARLYADMAAWIREASPGTLLLDIDELMREVGRADFFDRRYWYAARYPFGSRGAAAVADRVARIGALLKRPAAKVLVLDADNTLWGGVVGEDGLHGIGLGPDHPGNAFVDFQRRVLDFQSRGVLLALCSKNNAADVDAVLREHPHQILKPDDFVATRVNWLPKHENLVSLATELKLGLDAFIFVDDSDHECAAVRHHLPQVEVVQVPKRAVDIPRCLDHVARLDVLSLTAEDLVKTAMYAQERQRRALGEQVTTGGADYLERLQMRMSIALDDRRHATRLSQLSKKTNQFNLTTRRYEEPDIIARMDDPQALVLDFSLADTFGDSGIVGLAIWHLEGGAGARLDTFLMSCRVIGRQAECAFLQASLRLLADRGVVKAAAEYLPTAKNELVRDFLAGQGFERAGDQRWTRDLLQSPPEPASAFPIQVSFSTDKTARTLEPVSA